MKKIFNNLNFSYFLIVATIYISILILKEISFFEYFLGFVYALKPIWFGILLTFFLFPFIDNKRITVFRVILIYLVFIFIFIFMFLVFYYLIFMNVDTITDYLYSIYLNLISLSKEYELEKYIKLVEVKNVLLNSYEWVVPMVKDIFSFFTTFTFSLIISFCISLESKFLINKFKSYVINHEQYFEIYDIFCDILKKYVYSTSLDILYIVISTTIILYLFKTPYALLLSIILAFFNIFPYIGAIFGNGLLMLFHLFLVKENTIFLFIVILINSQIESHLIHTWICKKTMEIHPLFLFVALLISQYIFGFIGIILSPIFASILQLSILTYSEYLSKKDVGGWEKIIS